MRAVATDWVEREHPRIKVLIRVRLRAGALPTDACIRDISSRGLLVQAGAPPVRGTHIEILGPFAPIVGRVIWANARRFGVQTQDPIDVPGLVSGTADRRKAPIDCDLRRRTDDRKPRRDSAVREHIGSWIQFAAVLLIGAGVAIGVGAATYQQLSKSAHSIEAGLE